MSTTIDGVIFPGISLIGDCSWAEASGATLTVDPYGLDTSVRRYTGSTEGLAEELRQNWQRDRDKTDPVYDHCYLTDFTARDSGPKAEILATFKGTYDGSPITEAVPSWGVRAASVTLRYTSDNAEEETAESITLGYYAPFTTWRYAMIAEPKAARFRSKLKLVKDAWAITSIVGDSLKRRNFIKGGSFQAGGGTSMVAIRTTEAFNAVQEIVTSQFDVVRAGRWHLITETNEGRLLPWDLGEEVRRVVQ